MNNRLRLLSYVVIAYMLLAFAWWTVLLNNKNEEAYQARKDYLRIVAIAEDTYGSEEQFTLQENYRELKERYDRRQFMIFGESLVFVISLFIGFWLINKGYNGIIRNSRNKTNFLLSISHELKSPVASVRLALETLLKRDLNGDQIKKISRSALSENTRLSHLIDNLLLAAKLEEPYELHPEKFNIEDLVHTIRLNERLKFPDAIIDIDVARDVREIYTDKFAVQTILINLIGNALKYSPDEKKVMVRIFKKPNQWVLTVADCGMGIPDKEKDKVFDKFYRLGSEFTRKTKGTGLGLFIISKMVKALSGNISVKDNDPTGTVFTIHFKNQVLK